MDLQFIYYFIYLTKITTYMDSVNPTFVLTLITILISIGVQYGVYQSFKTRTELELQKFEERMTLLEMKSQQSDLKLQQVLDKVDNLERMAISNWQRIFNKLDQYDEGIKDFYKNYELKKRNT